MKIQFKYTALIIVLTAMLIAPAMAAGAGKDKDLGTFGVWHAYAYEEGGQTVCYMVTTKSEKPTGKNKGRTSYLMITHRPIEASIDVFSYGAGVALDSKHGVSLKIGKDSFDLFSVKDTSWSRDAMTDHKIAGAIRNGNTAQAFSIALLGRAATLNDKFVLTGSLSAYRAISKACGVSFVERKKPASKKPEIKKSVIKKQAPSKATAKKPAASKTLFTKRKTSK